MNALLDPLRQIGRDLVAKKLWPIAALLLVAIVALPVLIGSSSSDAPAPAPVALATPPSGADASLITVVDRAVTGKDDRPGTIKDPIYDPADPPAAQVPAGTSPQATPNAGAKATGTAATPTPAGTTASQPTPGRATTTKPAAPAAASGYFRTVVRWYSSERSKAKPIRRLTPLGGAQDPAALFLGVTVTKGGTAYAVFLLAPGATSAGDADCEDEACRVIGLKKGQSQVVTVPAADGGEARRYHLDVVSVKPVATDAATAAKMRAKVHADGREVMRGMWQDAATAESLGPIRYAETIGLLYKPAAAAPAKATK